MQIVHRISLSSTPEIRSELATMGVVVGASGFVSFEVDESHDAWLVLKGWIERRRAVDIVSTRFSKKELAEARWLALVPDWHHGYPQPKENIFGYRDATYDLTDYCQHCGIGLKQKAPFQMKTEPKWGRNGILQLNWVFDEYFVTPEIWATVFRPQGVGCRSVTNPKGLELKTVVQLVVDEWVSVITEGLAAQTCGACGGMKYLPVTRGPFPALVNEPPAQMVKTKEYFGSGASAHRRILISQSIAGALESEKVRGASAKPVAGPNGGKG